MRLTAHSLVLLSKCAELVLKLIVPCITPPHLLLQLTDKFLSFTTVILGCSLQKKDKTLTTLSTTTSSEESLKKVSLPATMDATVKNAFWCVLSAQDRRATDC